MKYHLILFFLLTVIGSASSQVLKSDTLKRNSNTQTEVIMFEEDKSSSRPSRNHRPNIIKVSTLSWPSGYIPVYYERQLTDYMSIQAGIGITTRDFIGDLTRMIYTGLGNDKPDYTGTVFDDVEDEYWDYKIRKATMGYCFTVSPKFFPSNDGFEGFYIAPELWLKHYNFKVERVNAAGIRMKNSFDMEFNRHFDFLVNFGYQSLFDVLMLDVHLGIGVRRTWSSRQDIARNSINDEYVNRMFKYNSWRPLLSAELKLGVQF